MTTRKVKRIKHPEGDSDLARYLVERVLDSVGVAPVFCGGFYKYDVGSGVWRFWPESSIKAELQSLHRKVTKVSRYQMNGAVEVMQVLCMNDSFFSGASSGVCCSNGFVEVSPKGSAIVPHSPNHRARFGYNHVFDSTRRPDEFLAFLREVWAPDKDREDKIKSLAEFLGACIVGIATQFEQAFLLYGRDGRNGKSVLISAIETLFPSFAHVSIPPQKWNNEYYLAEIIDARINLVGEVPRAEIVDGADFKAVISGDFVTGRRIYGGPIRFRPVAGHIFACNNLPTIADVGLAFWRRWHLLEFNRVFDGDVLKKVLIEKITSDPIGLVAWAVNGVVRLLKNGTYTLPASSAQAKDAWSLRADQVRSFLLECSEKGGKTNLLRAYEEYRHWAVLNGHSRLSKSTFKDRLIGLGHAPKRGDKHDIYSFEIKGRELWGGNTGIMSVV